MQRWKKERKEPGWESHLVWIVLGCCNILQRRSIECILAASLRTGALGQ